METEALPGEASASHLVEVFASQLSVGFGVSSFLWSSVIIWLNEEPPRVCGSSNDAALSAGCCSAALGAGADLGGLQHKHGAQLLSSGASDPVFLPIGSIL